MVMALMSVAARRRSMRAQRSPDPSSQVRILIHSINDDRCTGCDACVAVCPTNVLDLISNKSRVVAFQDCIQCEACMWACPTEALVMHPEGSHPPPVKVPEIDGYYQTAIPGQYLIGEVAGKPLVKNAANLGRAVVEHMLQEGLRPGGGGREAVDVAIVGSGPGGLSAALTCRQRGLSYVIIEKENVISSTVSRYPKGKLVMAEPYDTQNLSFLPVFDSSKEELVNVWADLVERLDLKIRLHETVQAIQKMNDGWFDVSTTAGRYRAQRVVLATGTRGKPRTLNVPGENLPKVESLLEDPDRHRGQAVCVVGGGDSALEAALALADAGAKVILSYRGKTFHRAQPKNRQKIEAYAREMRIKVKNRSEVAEFAPDTVTLRMHDGMHKRYPNEAAFVLIGADPPIQWLSTLGIHYVERPHMAPMPASDELVRRMVRNPQECPTNAEDAAALVLGQPLRAHAESARPKQRFVRSASQLFGLTDDDALEGPIPLSEFAKRRKGRGGRRDSLDAGERTRILRMLRDEGGRRADEDSKVQLLRDIVEDTPDGSPPGSPLPGGGLHTLPPLSGNGSPRQAVIVGLAKATAQAPPGRKRKPLPPPAPPRRDSPPEFLSDAQARSLLDLQTDESPEIADFDPEAMVRRVGDRQSLPFEPSVHEEATRNIDVDAILIDTGQRASAAPSRRPFEAPTRVVDANSVAGGPPRSLSEVDWDLD
jgi:putative YpdA family bacillithiol system oxidoreductase